MNSVSPNRETIDQAVLECVLPELDKGEHISMSVCGNSMQPVLNPGDRITLSRELHYRSGDIVAYYCPHRKLRTVHRFLGYVGFGKNRKMMLIPEGKFKADTLLDVDAVIGKVIEIDGRGEVVNAFWTRLNSTVKYFVVLLTSALSKLARLICYPKPIQ